MHWCRWRGCLHKGKSSARIVISDLSTLTSSEPHLLLRNTSYSMIPDWRVSVQNNSRSRWNWLVYIRCQRTMARLLQVDRQATITQITTRYNNDMQQSISEWTLHPHRTLKQMDCSIRPHQVRLLWAKNGKLRLQFRDTKTGLHKFRKMLPALMSLDFCCFHSDGMVRIWYK